MLAPHRQAERAVAQVSVALNRGKNDHRTVRVGRHLWKPSSTTALPRQVTWSR